MRGYVGVLATIGGHRIRQQYRVGEISRPVPVYGGVSRKVETAIGMSAATTFVLTLSAILSYMINSWILAPLGLEFLRTIAFIIAIAAVVNFTELVVHKTSPLLYNVLGIFLPLITTNCAVLGVALINVQEANSFIESAIYGFGAALGFSLVLILFAAMRERINVADVPVPFQGFRVQPSALSLRA